MTLILVFHESRSVLLQSSKRDPKILTHKKKNLVKHYNSNKRYSDDRDSLLNITIREGFPGHCSFNGKINEYHPASDNYPITIQK